MDLDQDFVVLGYGPLDFLESEHLRRPVAVVDDGSHTRREPIRLATMGRIEEMADNPFDFTGRTALVTGCGSDKGIGFAAARLLARLGAALAITSTTAERIEARASELRGAGAKVFSHVA